MSLGLQATKRRMQSVSSTRKITNAMHLVATSKFKAWKNKVDGASVYADELKSLFAQIFISLSNEEIEDYFSKKNEVGKKLYIIVTSSLGLCGGYNYNVYKEIKPLIKEDDELIVIGTKGNNYFKRSGYNVNSDFEDLYSGFSFLKVKDLASYALSRVRTLNVDSINIVYTKFVNSIAFTPAVETLYPLNKDSLDISLNLGKKEEFVLIEPTPKEVLDVLVPLYFQNILYGRLIESGASEQASRRNAMESATDNADELISKLQIDYNKARQGAITQEITEVVSGANALE
ncbi:MAG: ATP synthase F1 subunit gamma [Bacilli bacterium]